MSSPKSTCKIAQLLGLCALVFMAIFQSAPAHANPEADHISGLTAYENGDYGAAISHWKALAEADMASSEVYFNLGNAYYRENALGEAIWAYRMTLLEAPRDADALANLSYMRQQTKDKFTEANDELKARDILFWADSLSLFEQILVIALMNAIAWFNLGHRFYHRRRDWPPSIPLAFTLTAVLLLAAGLRQYELSVEPGGVILESEVTARSGTDAKSVPLFYLHEGAEIKVLGKTDGAWVQILLPDGRRGFVEGAFVGVVR